MRKQVKLTFAKNSETGLIEIINQYSDLGYDLNFDLGVAITGIISVTGFQDYFENSLFVICDGKTIELENNVIDGEVYFKNKVDGILSNDIPIFSALIEIADETEYTDNELSAITHAQSVLYRAGLKTLANDLGAPKPKP